MDPQARQLATRLTAAFNGGGAASSSPWLWRPLLQLLAQGQPVTADQLAAATGRTTEEIRDVLSANPDTEYDEHGRVVGSGLTQRPTPHRFEVDGRTLYTWCALDTLIFPAVLGLTAQVSSPCHATGTTIRVTVEPDRVTAIEPADAVVSVVTPDTATSIRSAFCDQVHFFSSHAAAQPWLKVHPGATVLPIADAHQLGRPLTEALDSGRGAPSG
jgi:alkylmercury lyase